MGVAFRKHNGRESEAADFQLRGTLNFSAFWVYFQDVEVSLMCCGILSWKLPRDAAALPGFRIPGFL